MLMIITIDMYDIIMANEESFLWHLLLNSKMIMFQVIFLMISTYNPGGLWLWIGENVDVLAF